MKKVLLFFAALLLANLSSYAVEEVYKTALFGSSYNSRGVSAYNVSWSATNDGFTVNLVNFNNNNNGWAYVKAGNKSTAYVGTITTAAAIDEAVTKVVLTIDAVTASNINSVKLYSGTTSSAITTEEGSFTVAAGRQTVTINNAAADKYYKIAADCKAVANGSITISKVEYYYDNTSVSQTLSGISLSGQTTSFYVGDDFAFGGVVTASYEETSVADADVTNEATFSGYDMSQTGTQTVTVSYIEGGVTKTATYTITVNPIVDKTIAEFIAAQGGKCYLTGIVSNITNATYGNYTLTDDESNSILIYGTLTSTGQKGQFASLDIAVGDKIKVLANEYLVYNEQDEAKDVIFLEEIEIVKEQYTVTIEAVENGTLVVKNGDENVTSGSTVEEGTVLTIACTPSSEDYRFKNWQYKLGDGSYATKTTGTTVTVTDNISIRANFELIPVYTVAWSVNGEIVKTESVKEGTAVAAPSVENIGNKVFMGWVTTSMVDAASAPTYVLPSETATATITYYAVFATASTGGEASVRYQAVTTAPEDWSGDYVMVAGGNVVVLNGEATSAMTVLADAFDPTEDYSDYHITLAKLENGNYTIFLQENEKYLGKSATSTNFFMSDTNSGDGCEWIIGLTRIQTIINTSTTSTSERYIMRSGTKVAAYTYASTYSYAVLYKVNTVSYSDYCTTIEADLEYDYYMVGSAELFGAEGMKMDANGDDAYRLILNNVELAGGDYTYNVEARPVVEQSNAPRHIAAAAQADKSFTLAAGTYSLQFDYNAETGVLTSTNLTNGFPTALDNTEAQKVEKIVRDGKVVIIKNGVEYNAIGQKL